MQPDDEAPAIPDFNGVPIKGLFCLLNGRLIVRAVYDRRRPGDVAVLDGKNPIARHGNLPRTKNVSAVAIFGAGRELISQGALRLSLFEGPDTAPSVSKSQLISIDALGDLSARLSRPP
jgi:hypothetical protein